MLSSTTEIETLTDEYLEQAITTNAKIIEHRGQYRWYLEEFELSGRDPIIYCGTTSFSTDQACIGTLNNLQLEDEGNVVIDLYTPRKYNDTKRVEIINELIDILTNKMPVIGLRFLIPNTGARFNDTDAGFNHTIITCPYRADIAK